MISEVHVEVNNSKVNITARALMIVSAVMLQLMPTPASLLFVHCFTIQSQPRKFGAIKNDFQRQRQNLFMTNRSTKTTQNGSPRPIDEDNEEENLQWHRRSQKHHTLSVCMVPPSSDQDAWNAITKARTKLRDPGLYRWPPHVNLLYPFVSIRTNEENNIGNNADGYNNEEELEEKSDIDKSVLYKLRSATQQIKPFHVSLDSLGTFGSATRGVLWLYPRTFRNAVTTCSTCRSDKEKDFSLSVQSEVAIEEDEPIYKLQRLLEKEFPMCSEVLKQREFIPHMTLSHFSSLGKANATMLQTKEWWSSSCFLCEEIYLLERIGDDGQFKRIASLSLGSSYTDGTNNTTRLGSGIHDDGICIHNPPLAFPGMPCIEEEWVRQERMNLKAQRNNKAGSSRRRGPRSSGSARRRRRRKQLSSAPKPKTFVSGDSPEVIAKKRAERKARRERREKSS